MHDLTDEEYRQSIDVDAPATHDDVLRAVQRTNALLFLLGLMMLLALWHIW